MKKKIATLLVVVFGLAVYAQTTKKIFFEPVKSTVSFEAQSFKVLDADESNFIELDAPALSSDITFTLPALDGSNGQVLTTDGSGGLTFTSAASGANDTLSNLSSPTAINQDLLFNKATPLLKSQDDTVTVDIAVKSGDASAGDSGDVILGPGTASGTRGTINFLDGSEGVSGECWVSTGVGGQGNWDTCPGGGGGANVTLSNLTSPTSINQNLTFDASREINTPDDAIADATATFDISILTGNKSAGTGDSGTVTIGSGPSTGGTRGNIELDAPFIRIQNNQTFAGVFGGGERDIAMVDAAGRIQMGEPSVDFRISGPVTPATDSAQTLGTAGLRWSNISGDLFEGAGGLTIGPNTTPSGISSVASIIGNSMIDVGILTSNDAVADAAKTQDVFIETGNKSNASATADTGEVFIKTGDAAGSAGNSGNVNIEIGTSANGTPGALRIIDDSLGTASVNDVWALQNAVTGAGAWVTPATAGSAKNVGTYSSTSTITSTDDISSLSGASFTLTLTTAVGNTGKIFEIVHSGTSLSQVYTIDGNAAETIRGNATFLLHTNGQRVRIYSDGSNWQVLSHYTETAWASAGTMTISATTTGPTKGSVQSHDIIRWRRIGDTAQIRMNFRQTNATGSNAGSGDYLFDVTAIGSIDTAKLDVYATVEGWNSNFVNAFTVGTGGHGDGTTNAASAGIVPFDATYVRLVSAVIGTTGGFIGSAGYPLTGTNVWYTLNFTVPISGWEH